MKPMPARNLNLDALRGLAILLVLGSHYDYFHRWTEIGWTGVDLFFVLSGFLISGLMFAEYKRTGAIDVRRFWIRRGFKIWPPFYVFMLFTVLALALKHRPIPPGVLHDSLFLANYLSPFWGHTWSLAVEEHFYLVLPVLLIALAGLSKNKDNPFRAVPLVSILLTFGCLYLRLRVSEETGGAELAIHHATHLRIDSLFAGVTLGYFYHFEPESFKRRRPGWLLAGAAITMIPVVALAFFRRPISPLTSTLVFIAFTCLLVAVVDLKSPGWLSPLRFVGRYSYSIYLWHAALVVFIFEAMRPTLLLFSAYLICSVAVGVAMAKLVELPSLAFRDKCFPSNPLAGKHLLLQSHRPIPDLSSPR